MLDYFDSLLFQAIVDWNRSYNRASSEPAFAAMLCDSGINDRLEDWMICIVNSAYHGGLISFDDHRRILPVLQYIGLDMRPDGTWVDDPIERYVI